MPSTGSRDRTKSLRCQQPRSRLLSQGASKSLSGRRIWRNLGDKTRDAERLNSSIASLWRQGSDSQCQLENRCALRSKTSNQQSPSVEDDRVLRRWRVDRLSPDFPDADNEMAAFYQESNMKTQRVADLITDILYSAGVRRIYGVVGDSLNGITDAVRRRGELNGFTRGTKRLQHLRRARKLI